jgi:hypothetical protein
MKRPLIKDNNISYFHNFTESRVIDIFTNMLDFSEGKVCSTTQISYWFNG